MKRKNKTNSFSLNSFSKWVPKLLALLCAILIYVALRFFNMASRSVLIPLDVKLPADSSVIAESKVPTSVSVVISGNNSLIYLVDPDGIVASADFSAVDEEGIARVPVELSYNGKVFKDAALTVRANPDIVKVLFKKN
ncbi:MAG: hypothetical protein K6G51_05695 [Sphaerochaetaceae bacterium]|nr:hypothetical protein [Sphaerochaetaceae bacterium]